MFTMHPGIPHDATDHDRIIQAVAKLTSVYRAYVSKSGAIYFGITMPNGGKYYNASEDVIHSICEIMYADFTACLRNRTTGEKRAQF